MSTDTDSDKTPDEYWKRRAVVLGGMLAAVGLLAWGCSAGTGPDRPVRDAAALASASPAAPTALPTVTVTAQVTRTAAPRRRAGDACDRKDVVVDLAVSRTVYGRKDRPELRLTAVNTGAAACRFATGPKALDVRISSGSDRVWTASWCARGDASPRLLRRGIPYVRTLTWDRRRSSGRCGGSRPAARPGTYVAELVAPGLKAKRQVFALR
ncbi:hypothetical protein [Actinomadura rayongensis]|uniref:DUF4232 domain-containing protein n=1 Tax=Actinomadura rayongensis TaxID=1429076 RepID=A0A6I4VZ43_9ACTN|nr:hypothetical protein [Actinomadura rayongensis]MXQ62441.1 hypothetical protein [Actinomadura rayongensis]